MNKKTLAGISIFMVLIAVLYGIYSIASPTAVRGTKSYTLEVVSEDGSKRTYHGVTDSEYLKGAMDELAESQDFSYSGTEGNFFMVLTINGETASYDKDKVYWGIYDNDEYASNGVSSLPIQDGHTYRFEYRDNDDEEQEG